MLSLNECLISQVCARNQIFLICLFECSGYVSESFWKYGLSSFRSFNSSRIDSIKPQMQHSLSTPWTVFTRKFQNDEMKIMLEIHVFISRQFTLVELSDLLTKILMTYLVNCMSVLGLEYYCLNDLWNPGISRLASFHALMMNII